MRKLILLVLLFLAACSTPPDEPPVSFPDGPPPAKVDCDETFDHLPAWTNEQATAYFHAKGLLRFSGAYLESRSCLLQIGVANGTRGYRQYVIADDGLARPIGDPIAREAWYEKADTARPFISDGL